MTWAERWDTARRWLYRRTCCRWRGHRHGYTDEYGAGRWCRVCLVCYRGL